MIPNEVVAGDTVQWLDASFKDSLGNAIAPPDWTLKYAIRGAVSIDLTAVEDSGKWKTTLQPTDTADITATTILYWQSFATKGSDKITLAQGQVTVNPNLLDVSSSEFDGRSQAKKDLDAVQTAIRAKISGGAIAEYTIGNRSVRSIPIAELVEHESRLKGIVARENAAESMAKGLGNPNRVFVRFK
jgi:hypothetical protein